MKERSSSNLFELQFGFGDRKVVTRIERQFRSMATILGNLGGGIKILVLIGFIFVSPFVNLQFNRTMLNEVFNFEHQDFLMHNSSSPRMNNNSNNNNTQNNSSRSKKGMRSLEGSPQSKLNSISGEKQKPYQQQQQQVLATNFHQDNTSIIMKNNPQQPQQSQPQPLPQQLATQQLALPQRQITSPLPGNPVVNSETDNLMTPSRKLNLLWKPSRSPLMNNINNNLINSSSQNSPKSFFANSRSDFKSKTIVPTSKTVLQQQQQQGNSVFQRKNERQNSVSILNLTLTQQAQQHEESIVQSNQNLNLSNLGGIATIPNNNNGATTGKHKRIQNFSEFIKESILHRSQCFISDGQQRQDTIQCDSPRAGGAIGMSIDAQQQQQQQNKKNDEIFEKHFKTTYNPLKWSFLHSIFYFIWPFGRFRQAKKKINYSIQKLDYHLDSLYIVKKLLEVDKLKMLLLNENQIKLLEFLPKPTIDLAKLNESEDLDQKFNDDVQNINILYQDTRNELTKAAQAFQAFNSIKAKDHRSKIDRKLIELLDPKIAKYFDFDDVNSKNAIPTLQSMEGLPTQYQQSKYFQRMKSQTRGSVNNEQSPTNPNNNNSMNNSLWEDRQYPNKVRLQQSSKASTFKQQPQQQSQQSRLEKLRPNKINIPNIALNSSLSSDSLAQSEQQSNKASDSGANQNSFPRNRLAKARTSIGSIEDIDDLRDGLDQMNKKRSSGEENEEEEEEEDYYSQNQYDQSKQTHSQLNLGVAATGTVRSSLFKNKKSREIQLPSQTSQQQMTASELDSVIIANESMEREHIHDRIYQNNFIQSQQKDTPMKEQQSQQQQQKQQHLQLKIGLLRNSDKETAVTMTQGEGGETTQHKNRSFNSAQRIEINKNSLSIDNFNLMVIQCDHHSPIKNTLDQDHFFSKVSIDEHNHHFEFGNHTVSHTTIKNTQIEEQQDQQEDFKS